MEIDSFFVVCYYSVLYLFVGIDAAQHIIGIEVHMNNKPVKYIEQNIVQGNSLSKLTLSGPVRFLDFEKKSWH